MYRSFCVSCALAARVHETGSSRLFAIRVAGYDQATCRLTLPYLPLPLRIVSGSSVEMRTQDAHLRARSSKTSHNRPARAHRARRCRYRARNTEVDRQGNEVRPTVAGDKVSPWFVSSLGFRYPEGHPGDSCGRRACASKCGGQESWARDFKPRETQRSAPSGLMISLADVPGTKAWSRAPTNLCARYRE